MGFKRITISLDEDLNKLWNEVSKKHRITKSGMVELYLRKTLPDLKNLPITDANYYDELLNVREYQKGLFD